MFDEGLKNVEILAVLELSWHDVDQKALPRPYHALSFRIKGDNEFITANETIGAVTNDIVFVPKGVGFHQKAGDEKLYCIHFLADGADADRIVKFSASNGVLFQNLFSTMYNRWVHKKPGYKMGVMSDFYKIISKIQSRQSTSHLLPSSDNMHDILEYIHEHFTEQDLSVSSLSENFSISESYFRKLFNKHFGVSPIQYINNLRVSYATELIGAQYYKINEIAEMSGFSDSKYFSTVIKQKCGKSPSELKKQGNRAVFE